MEISKMIDENMKNFDEVFKDCGDMVKRKFPIAGHDNLNAFVIYIDALVDSDKIDRMVVNQLMVQIRLVEPTLNNLKEDVFTALKDNNLTLSDLKETDSFAEVKDAILSGDTALFIEGYKKAIVISSKSWPSRGVQSAETEVVVQGSKEAFSEGFRTNTALIRRRIRDANLKVNQLKVGERSATDVALMYLEDVVRPAILQEALKRIKNINIDAILDSGYIEQLIKEDWLSPFPQAQVTERPDKAAAAILEGRIVIVVDNSPFVLIIPATLNIFFQSSEDYYQNFEIMSFVRVIRYISGLICLFLPGLYIAIAVFHPSMIPMQLVFKMSEARQTVPFPAVVEILIMDLTFELLREAGIRLPGAIGSTIGIVGGLIIGQAAVEAGLVSPIVVIIVATTGIASFAIPHVSLVSGFRLMKYLVIITSGLLGIFGFWLALLVILTHLVSLRSFGIPYMFPFTSGDINDYSDLKDSIFRVPLFKMKKRPIFANPNEIDRLK